MTNVIPVSKAETLREQAENIRDQVEGNLYDLEGFDLNAARETIMNHNQRALELEQREIANLLRVVESEVFPNEIRVEAARKVQRALELG